MARDDMVLVVRVGVMYTVVLAVNLVTRFERSGRLRATERERALQRERIDLSQSIHDNAAQSVYMIGLGVDSARALAGDSNPELSRTLAATSQLSRTVMWELRRSIYAGRIFEGRDLGSVLREHAETFQRITAGPHEDGALRRGACAQRGRPVPALLHCSQRADQRLPARRCGECERGAGIQRGLHLPYSGG